MNTQEATVIITLGTIFIVCLITIKLMAHQATRDRAVRLAKLKSLRQDMEEATRRMEAIYLAEPFEPNEYRAQQTKLNHALRDYVNTGTLEEQLNNNDL